MQKPRPDNFGLPQDFDWILFKKRLVVAPISSLTRVYAYSFVFGFFTYLFAGFAARIVPGTTYWASPLSVLGVGGIVVGIGGIALDGFRARSKELAVEKSAPGAKAYGAALEEWEHYCLETGVGFWAGLRGVAFEQALSRLLTKRGCNVQMTKTTGDGGIDLIVAMTNGQFLCQCKGQQNPVSVKVIREIAGVCSRGSNRAVVFAVNGYTKPALDAARDLGVLLYDAEDIVRLAGLARVDTLGHTAPNTEREAKAASATTQGTLGPAPLGTVHRPPSSARRA